MQTAAPPDVYGSWLKWYQVESWLISQIERTKHRASILRSPLKGTPAKNCTDLISPETRVHELYFADECLFLCVSLIVYAYLRSFSSLHASLDSLSHLTNEYDIVCQSKSLPVFKLLLLCVGPLSKKVRRHQIEATHKFVFQSRYNAVATVF